MANLTSISVISFLLSILHLVPCLADNGHQSSAPLKSYLPAEGDSNSVTLVSPNGMFQLIVLTWSSPSGRYCMAGVNNVKVGEHPMIWAANDAEPFHLSPTQSCRFYLSEKGDLLLQYDADKSAWHTGTGGTGVSNLTLLDNGNLVLFTDRGSVAWQSFEQKRIFHMISGMNFTSNMVMSSATDFAGATSSINVPGNYAMQLLDQSGLALITKDSVPPFVYWRSSIAGLSAGSKAQSSYVTLDNDGFVFHDNSSKFIGKIAPSRPIATNFSSTIKVALLDPDSADLLAFYRANGTWENFFNSSISRCANPTRCGNFSLCNATSEECMCPHGFLQNGADCKLDIESESALFTCGGTPSVESYKFLAINVSFSSQLASVSVGSVENCKLLCAKECDCKVALFDPDTGSCSTFSSLRTVTKREESKQLMLLKVGIVGASSHRYAIIIGTSCSVIAALLTACIVIAVLRKKRKEKALDDEGFLQELPRLPTRYTYKELHAVTNGFAIKLGEGGFGEVYQGTLVSGTKVAVKMLQTTSKHSFAQFRSEVASIGIASHMNLVTLLGFCHSAEGKLLVYEYMTMGSLDRWLFGEGHKLGWGRRCKIAMDAARGLAYLHHECGQKVVHCDIKPENILLDDNFNAKIGDFGLAKLIEQDRQSFNMTTLKGTRGYLAPEWLQDAVITPRSDVYSFGVVLLELVTGHRCLEGNAGYLPTMAFRIVSESASASSMEVSLPWLASGERSRGDDSGETQPPPQPMCLRVVESCGSKMGALFDRRLSQDADMALASVQRMIFIALWCVQPDPTVRPPMNVVLQMLEGTLHVPPPLLQQTTRSMNSSSGFTSETTDTGTIESQPLIWSHPNTCLD